MKIVKLTAENFKRLKAVEIEPDGSLQVITGRNAQGKSSVLDAIWMALGGGTASREISDPLREGEESGFVTVDLGEFKITRTWAKGGKTALKLESADGAQFRSPQTMLDNLLNRISFDPYAFIKMQSKEQVATLLELVDLDIDLDENASERQRLYDLRTSVGRDERAIGEMAVSDELPEVEESASEVIGALREAQELHRQRNEATEAVEQAKQYIERLRADLANWEVSLAGREKELANFPEEMPDVEAIESRLSTVEESNAAIRANNAARDLMGKKADLAKRYEEITSEIDALDKAKSDALAAAKFPVEGLGFDDDGVTFKGRRLSSASERERNFIGVEIAIALNPDARVMRIKDGSLIDKDGMAQLAEIARKSDFQIWVERVEDASATAVVIEDGQVAS